MVNLKPSVDPGFLYGGLEGDFEENLGHKLRVWGRAPKPPRSAPSLGRICFELSEDSNYKNEATVILLDVSRGSRNFREKHEI